MGEFRKTASNLRIACFGVHPGFAAELEKAIASHGGYVTYCSSEAQFSQAAGSNGFEVLVADASFVRPRLSYLETLLSAPRAPRLLVVESDARRVSRRYRSGGKIVHLRGDRRAPEQLAEFFRLNNPAAAPEPAVGSRAAPRFLIPPRLRLKVRLHQNNQRHYGEVLDISESGLRIQKPAALELQIGTPVDLLLLWTSQSLSLQGVIRHADTVAGGPETELGIQFLALEPAQVARLRFLLQLIAERGLRRSGGKAPVTVQAER